MIETFYDKGLAHASYALLSGKEIVLIDPARNPKAYYDFAALHDATIIGIIETHPHADFVSSHLEIHQATKATIYVNSLVGATYPHQTFDEGQAITFGNYTLLALHTPGHSPDSNCVLLIDETGKELALFTGDTLFVGDVGRPDLRENVGNVMAKREELAKAMFYSLREKIMPLPDHLIIYPSHGPGSLCGRSISTELSSTLGQEKQSNYALAEHLQVEEFMEFILKDQPWVPKYFNYCVSLNKKGVPSYQESISGIKRISNIEQLENNAHIVDTRSAEVFRSAHISGSINIPDGNKFETWLGSILAPEEPFYLVIENESTRESIIEKVAKIGYEKFLLGIYCGSIEGKTAPEFSLDSFIEKQQHYTLVDIRHSNEVSLKSIFENTIHIPLPELRERMQELPKDKPLVVHCAGGLRSAMGTSLIRKHFPNLVIYDMGPAIKTFSN